MSDKSSAESYQMHANLINDKEFAPLKVLKLRYRRSDQTFHTFCRTGSPHKLTPPSLIGRNFKSLGKVLLNHREGIEI